MLWRIETQRARRPAVDGLCSKQSRGMPRNVLDNLADLFDLVAEAASSVMNAVNLFGYRSDDDF